MVALSVIRSVTQVMEVIIDRYKRLELRDFTLSDQLELRATSLHQSYGITSLTPLLFHSCRLLLRMLVFGILVLLQAPSMLAFKPAVLLQAISLAFGPPVLLQAILLTYNPCCTLNVIRLQLLLRLTLDLQMPNGN
ncbi:hypothetical protein TIFTF001_039673 [Ficus carica]|uniref:Uncharacterized protein n=1 Tax=Ficus carica TaxID=3494 RepID=A0AA88E9Z2_FICCA|nr:hypothetical protein TIFTF001_039673 [Ficus carica]